MRRHQGQLNNNTSLLSYKRADNRSPFSLNTPFIYQIRRFTPLLVEETGNVPLRLVTNPMKPVWPRRSSGRDDKMLIFSWTFVHYQDDDSLTRTSPRCLVQKCIRIFLYRPNDTVACKRNHHDKTDCRVGIKNTRCYPSGIMSEIVQLSIAGKWKIIISVHSHDKEN